METLSRDIQSKITKTQLLENMQGTLKLIDRIVVVTVKTGAVYKVAFKANPNLLLILPTEYFRLMQSAGDSFSSDLRMTIRRPHTPCASQSTLTLLHPLKHTPPPSGEMTEMLLSYFRAPMSVLLRMGL